MSRSAEIYSVQKEQEAEERIEIEFPLGVVSTPYYSGRLIRVLKGPDVNSILVTEENPMLLSDISREVFGTPEYDQEKRDKLLRARTVAQKKLEPVRHIIEAVREEQGSIVTGLFMKERPLRAVAADEDIQVPEEDYSVMLDELVLDIKRALVKGTVPDFSPEQIQTSMREMLKQYGIPPFKRNFLARRTLSEMQVWWEENKK